MYNINFEAHNNYTFTTIDENGKVIEKKTIYNTAKPGLFVAEAGNYAMNGTTLEITYRPSRPDDSTDDTESVVTAGVGLYRMTPSSEIHYGGFVKYSGSVDFSPSINFVGTITSVSLGRHVLYNEDQTVKDTLHWSEGGGIGIEKSSTMSLHIDVELYLKAETPGGKYYDENISSVLHKNQDNGLLTPLPQWVGLSSFNVTQLSSPLHKRVPVLHDMPTEIVRDYEQGTSTIKNKVNNEESDSFFVSGTNSTLSTNISSYNVGILKSIVFGDVSVNTFGGSFGGSSKSVYIPAVVLTQGLINELKNSYPNEDEFYFFCIEPEGSSSYSVSVNGTTDNNLSFISPRTIPRMTSTRVGLTANEDPRDITRLRNTSTGTYYSQYILGNDEYWEPELGCPTCPPYVYLNGIPDNVRCGPSASVTIQALVGNNWVNVGARGKATNGAIYLNNVEGTNTYRAVVSAPQFTDSFFVNQYEKSTVPHKSYDPYVICIGGIGCDFGKVGIKILRDDLQKYCNSYIGIEAEITDYYKSSNTVAFLSCSMTARGA